MSGGASNADTDGPVEFGWLEEIHGDAALKWVDERNRETLARLEADERFQRAMRRSVALPSPLERVGKPFLVDGWVHERHRPAGNPDGIWRRTPLAQYGKPDAEAEVLLDLSTLPDHEGVPCSWSWFGAVDPVFCVQAPSRCLMRLNVAGGDRVILREFDVERRAFVDDGFRLDIPSAIEVQWLDADTLMIIAELDPAERSLGGWPRVIRRWSRGTRIEDAPIAFDPGSCAHVKLAAGSATGRPIQLVNVLRTYAETELWMLEEGQAPRRMPLPSRLGFSGTAGMACGRLVFHTDVASQVCGVDLPESTLASFDLDGWLAGRDTDLVHPIFSARQGHVFNTIFGALHMTAACAPAALWYVTIEQVRPRLWRASFDGQAWRSEAVALPEWHNVSFSRCDGNRCLAHVESFIDPPSVWLLSEGASHRELTRGVAAVDLAGYRVEQRWAASADGTQVPYFLIAREDPGQPGPRPTMLYAYGGFGLTLTPQYFAPFAGCDALLHWLAEGGTYVVANLRGGGELGPQWAASATGPNRQRVFDDFYAVAEALIRDGVTTREQLAATGLSNGGLLTSVALTQRPDLFRAVLSGVPLTDMARFHKLLAGMSWVSDYGNPDIPEQREWVMRYSPLHHVQAARAYPEPLYYTTTSDDRVHPGHARRMVAKLRAKGHAALYFEPRMGGHAGSMDAESAALMSAVQATYLMQKTGLAAPADS